MLGQIVAFIESISIHAPAKGATWFKVNWIDKSEISIHAPAKGATLKRLVLALRR